jgi:alpha/beta hydrolase family protein
MKGLWLRGSTGNACTVFVHGVLSDGESCWTNQNGSYWPELVSKELGLESLGIYVFTYQTGFFSGSYRLSNVVDALKEHMRLDRVLEAGQLIFVCHSMGGIVVRKFLVERAAELIDARKRIGLFLVASPSLGSSYADWLSPVARFLGHSQADALRFVRGNEWLSDLDKEFKNLKEAGRLPMQGKELIEDRFLVLPGLVRRQVVEAFSGALYFGESYKVPESDHCSIAKPENSGAIQHRLLCEFIRSFISSGAEANSTRSPSAPIALSLLQREVEALHYSPTEARLNFSVTNLTGEQVKLLTLRLQVRRRQKIKKFRLPTPGAPHAEFELKADISETDSVDLLADVRTQFILKPGDSDAFSVVVTAKEGFRYEATVDCECEILGQNGRLLCTSTAASLTYPIRTLGGMEDER